MNTKKYRWIEFLIEKDICMCFMYMFFLLHLSSDFHSERKEDKKKHDGKLKHQQLMKAQYSGPNLLLVL